MTSSTSKRPTHRPHTSVCVCVRECVCLRKWSVSTLFELIHKPRTLLWTILSGGERLRQRLCARLEWPPVPTQGDPREAGGPRQNPPKRDPDTHRSRQPPHRALVVRSARLGTMSEGSWSGSMWRATWILCFSLLIHSAQAQGKRGPISHQTGPISGRASPAMLTMSGRMCDVFVFLCLLHEACHFLIRLHVTATHSASVLIAGCTHTPAAPLCSRAPGQTPQRHFFSSSTCAPHGSNFTQNGSGALSCGAARRNVTKCLGLISRHLLLPSAVLRNVTCVNYHMAHTPH